MTINFQDLVSDLRRFDRFNPGVLPSHMPRGVTALKQLRDHTPDEAARTIIDNWIAWNRQENKRKHAKWRANHPEREAARLAIRNARRQAERDQDARLAV